MARESTQHKLDRLRSPLVHIIFDFEIGDAIEVRQLPFVMGVLGDLSGQPTPPRSRSANVLRSTLTISMRFSREWSHA
jgi:type VI secretion system ImpB/VipA family protein